MAFNPDDPGISFDDLYDAWLMVAAWEAKLDTAERLLDRTRAEIKLAAGKVTGEHLKQIVHFIGNNVEDSVKLETLEDSVTLARQNLVVAKGKLDVLQTKIRVWQSISANMRKTLVVE